MKRAAILVVLCLLCARASVTAAEGTVSGELKKWHRVTVSFDGPATAEDAEPNPFRDHRLTVTFTKADRKVVVPGYFAADGKAGQSGAAKGNTWRAHLAPDEEGEWSYVASFRTGKDVAASLDTDAGKPAAFDGASGSFRIGPSDKTGRDHRAKGMLRYVGQHYLQFAETGEWFIKGGADSPENFLGYVEFDGTYRHGKAGGRRRGEAEASKLHRYEPHRRDWRPGDPTWRDGKGRNIIGALNYLASKGMNSVYMLTMNVTGDGKDVWPWTSHDERFRFDCSKLDQWEIVFSHMDRLGLMLHLITQETENDQLLDRGELGIERKLYYRELVARFAHHLAITWNLGEENTNTDAQRKAFARYIHALDPYDHPVVCHTFPGRYDRIYEPLLGYEHFEGPSLQTNDTHRQTLRWVARSVAAGRKWIVCLDEIGPANTGVKPDADDPAHDEVRTRHLWGNLTAGGAGCEWYMGYRYAHNDLNCEDWRSRDRMWDQTRFALDLFRRLPVTEMVPADGLVDHRAWCFAKPGYLYLLYLPRGGTAKLNVGKVTAQYGVRWYNPRKGGTLQKGSLATVKGPGTVSLGGPPSDPGKDWAVLVKLPDGVTIDPNDLPALTTAPPDQPAPGGGKGDVVGFTLINADTNQPIGPLKDGATLDLSKLPTRNLNVRADTRPANVGSVRFKLDGKTVRTEGTAPYALAGDQGGRYSSWTPSPGRHTLTATPYSRGGARGKALTVRFTVVAP